MNPTTGTTLSNLVGQDGIKINVGVDMNSILLLVGGVFIAVVLAGVLTHVINTSIDKAQAK